VGTCDGRTQSARACKPALLHLALRTWVSGPRYLALKTWVSGPQYLALRNWVSRPHRHTHSQDLGFRTSTDARKLSILRSSTSAQSCVLSFSRHFSLRPADTIRSCLLVRVFFKEFLFVATSGEHPYYGYSTRCELQIFNHPSIFLDFSKKKNLGKYVSIRSGSCIWFSRPGSQDLGFKTQTDRHWVSRPARTHARTCWSHGRW
jgi:hypothetical protein